MDVRNLEGYEEEIKRLMSAMPPELRLAGLPPEQRVAGLAPEQRMAGLGPEQRMAGIPVEQLVLGLPDELLRALSDAYLAGLPADTVAAIRKRLGQG